MARRGVNVPALTTQFQTLAGLQQAVRSKAGAVLTGCPKVQGLLVPLRHRPRFTGRNPGLQRRVARCQGRVAPTVVAVQVGVEQQIKLATLELPVHKVHQHRGVGVVAAVNQHRVFATLQEHAVRRKPAALEDVNTLG